MLLLLLNVGAERYALPAGEVVEVVPLAELRKLPHAPEYVAGLLHYRGAIAPVIDVSALAVGTPCRERLSTRIVVVDYPAPDGRKRPLGLMAERVTETRQVPDEDLASPGIEVAEAPYLGAVATVENEMIQLLRLDRLLPEDLRRRLFTDEAPPADGVG